MKALEQQIAVEEPSTSAPNRSSRPPTVTALQARFSQVRRMLSHQSPARLLLLIYLAILVAHAVAMMGFDRLLPAPGWSAMLVQSAMLVVILFPMLYLFAFRPLTLHIAERERAEAVMRESEHKQRHVFESLSDAAFLVDVATGRIIDTNRQAEVLLGRPRENIMGKSHVKLHPPKDAEECQRRLTVFDAQNPVMHFDGTVLRSDGSQVPVHVSSAPLTLYGRDLVLSLYRDVTEQRALQAQLLRAQRLESVGALASGIAHDLNNVLQPILIAAELLQPSLREGEDRLGETIRTSARRGAEIVQQVLSFARGAQGERNELQLRHLMRELKAIVSRTLPKSIQIHCQLDKNLWAVTGNATQLHQALMNLAVNARDAMSEGGELTLSAENLMLSADDARLHPDAQAGPHVRLRVKDTGSGIDPAILDKIFDPYFTTKPLGEGTGLGLATTLGIVKGHGGFIHVTSRQGQGTRFDLYLPALPQAEAQAAELETGDTPVGHGELILVAEDEPAIREMTCLALKSSGYSVLSAADGVEAVKLGSQHLGEIKLAVVDTMMPFLDGAATIRALRRLDPQVRIVRISGAMDAARNGSADLPPHAFLQKPFSTRQLAETIDQVLAA